MKIAATIAVFALLAFVCPASVSAQTKPIVVPGDSTETKPKTEADTEEKQSGKEGKKQKPNKPRRKKEEPKSCPDANHPHAIDLALPSGTKWACCNVGASEPAQYGQHYAWGEKATKDTYTWETYMWWDTARKTLTKYCKADDKTRLDKSNDVANAAFGGRWRMPDAVQFAELIDECKWEWTTMDGHNGYLVTGANDHYIFLPAAGLRETAQEDTRQGRVGFYLSRDICVPKRDTTDFFLVHALQIVGGTSTPLDGFTTERNDRCLGQSIRPVK